MIAYKFLVAGRVGRFSQVRWPEPGVWMRAGSPVVPCRRGVHACRVRDLPWWLADELWEVELVNPTEVRSHKLVAPAGRLRDRIDVWTPDCAQEYAAACFWHARDLAVQALRRARHEAAAAHLARCETFEDLAGAVERLGEIPSEARPGIETLGSAAAIAVFGGPPMIAYMAAHVAGRLDPRAGYDDERGWQSRWLADRLGLTADP